MKNIHVFIICFFSLIQATNASEAIDIRLNRLKKLDNSEHVTIELVKYAQECNAQRISPNFHHIESMAENNLITNNEKQALSNYYKVQDINKHLQINEKLTLLVEARKLLSGRHPFIPVLILEQKHLSERLGQSLKIDSLIDIYQIRIGHPYDIVEGHIMSLNESSWPDSMSNKQRILEGFKKAEALKQQNFWPMHLREMLNIATGNLEREGLMDSIIIIANYVEHEALKRGMKDF